MIAGLGLDYCWSRFRTKGLGKQPILVSKKSLGLGLGFGLEAVVSTTTLVATRPSAGFKRLITIHKY